MLELTLQEGRDALIRDHALKRCGLNSALLKPLLPGPTMYRMAMATPGYTAEPREPISVDSSHESTASERDIVNIVRDELERLDHEFWREAALEFDRLSNGVQSVLTVIGDIPPDPHQTRVTSTSLARFVKRILGQEGASTEGAAPQDLDPDQMSARERTLLRMLALAARDLATEKPQLMKPTGTPNLDSVAASWLRHLQSSEYATGLSTDNISRAISGGFKQLQKI